MAKPRQQAAATADEATAGGKVSQPPSGPAVHLYKSDVLTGIVYALTGAQYEADANGVFSLPANENWYSLFINEGLLREVQ